MHLFPLIGLLLVFLTVLLLPLAFFTFVYHQQSARMMESTAATEPGLFDVMLVESAIGEDKIAY